jgi:hypothetical protein
MVGREYEANIEKYEKSKLPLLVNLKERNHVENLDVDGGRH